MGYYVRFLPRKKKAPVWKVQFVSYKRSDRPGSTSNEERKRAWDISKDRWRALGFSPVMTIEDARVRARQLNAQLKIKHQEERIREIQKKRVSFQMRHEATLPEEFVAEFEERFVRPRSVFSDEQKKRIGQRRYTACYAAQKIIVQAGIEPTNWYFHPGVFYDLFYERKYSFGYVKNILAMMNLWGDFFTRKLAHPFAPLRPPRGYEKKRILEAYYQKKHRRQPSRSTTPEHLEMMKGHINQQNFNWLYISVWLGLRPQEIDNLKDDGMWKVEILPTGRKVFWVFQTKIIALPPEDRWKPIPILFDEQNFALKMIEDKNFKRPLTKTIHKYIGEGHDTYGGRKGFVDLMLSKNQALENISIWMGHTALNRTWRSYKNKRVYHE